MSHPVAFALEGAEVADDRLVLTGRWSGVRGVRFVRPALVLPDRDVLATLDHKPWAVLEDTEWTVAFPWPDGGPPDLATAQLAVAPSITVPLDPDAPEPPSDLGLEAHAGRLQHEVDFLRGRREDELVAARHRIDAVEDARDALRDQLAAAEARAERAEAEARSLRDRLERTITEAGSLRARLGATEAGAGEVATEADALRAQVGDLEKRLRRAGAVAAQARAAAAPAPREDSTAPSEAQASVDELDPGATRAFDVLPGARGSERLPGLDQWAQRIVASTAAMSLLVLLVGLVRAMT